MSVYIIETGLEKLYIHMFIVYEDLNIIQEKNGRILVNNEKA